MKPRMRKVAKSTLGLLMVALAIGVLYVVTLTFPSPWFAHRRSFGDFRVYSDSVIPDDFGLVVEDLDRRLGAMDPVPPAASQRIYLCGMDKYRFFSFLTRRNPESLGIGLSVANLSFVSVERARRFAELNRGLLRHTRFEGNVAEIVAHEIAHFNSVHELGLRAHLSQPLWKSEGWAEYQANLAAIRTDPDYDLARRIDALLDPSYWGGRYGMARYFWESQLLVEYLGEIEGYRLSDLILDDVSEHTTRERMMAWYRGEVATSSANAGR